SHSAIMERLIAPKGIKNGIFRCLKAGVNPEYPEQGTPQGGVAAFKVFNREPKQNRESSKRLLDRAFPKVPYSENKHVNVTGEKSPFDGDLTYWSERNSKLYAGETSKALKRQNHKCGYCGLKMLPGETVHLHHIDGNHKNWKTKNLLAIHESCHDYIHMGKTAR
ncbi:MAG: hypothetical protein AB1589_46045, partial [Cyanobacteriota bacterium]